VKTPNWLRRLFWRMGHKRVRNVITGTGPGLAKLWEVSQAIDRRAHGWNKADQTHGERATSA